MVRVHFIKAAKALHNSLKVNELNESGEGQFVLDYWVLKADVPYTQRVQDVYNRALYLRTSTGMPINVLSGGEYTLGEVTAAEAGARAGGILNNFKAKEKLAFELAYRIIRSEC